MQIDFFCLLDVFLPDVDPTGCFLAGKMSFSTAGKVSFSTSPFQ